MSGEVAYAFDNARQVQVERLRALEEALDPGTIRHIEACGVGPGWRCLELGAGGGSIANHLAARVGPHGAVAATDLDTTVLQARARPDVDVRVHDVLADDFPPATYDFIHFRLLLAWLPDRRACLARILRWLKPGGWLLAEEMDFVSVTSAHAPDRDAAAVFDRVVLAHIGALSARHGFDAYYGRRLPRDLESVGVEHIASEGRVSIWGGGSPGMRVWSLTFQQLRASMIATGISGSDVDQAIGSCEEPEMRYLSPLVLGAWGRRPREEA